MLNVTEEVGKYFGYPICCIKGYENIQINAGRKTVEQSLVIASNNGGFIPCPNHAKQILEGKITLQSLITNRICPMDFPNEPPIEAIDEYLTVISQ